LRSIGRLLTAVKPRHIQAGRGYTGLRQQVETNVQRLVRQFDEFLTQGASDRADYLQVDFRLRRLLKLPDLVG
jgi:hypothetical protein